MAPVITFVGTPPPEYQPANTNLFAAKFSGINTMVCKFAPICITIPTKKNSNIQQLQLLCLPALSDAYSGAVMFVAFLAEMRRPMDFWKGMLVAQTFITIVYVVFGVIVSFELFHCCEGPDIRLTWKYKSDLPLLRSICLQQR